MQGKIMYEFTATLWQHKAQGGWHFVSLPQNVASEVRAHLKWQEEGWGRLKATAKIADCTWKTAIWFDTKLNTYLLPVKAEIRKKAKLETNKIVNTFIWV